MPHFDDHSPLQRSRALARAKAAALRHLTTRARSVDEVSRRLALRYAPDVVQEVISGLRDQGYLNDSAFAEAWRQHRERSSPRGERLMRQELLRLGVENEVVNEALTGLDACGNAYRAAQRFAQKHKTSDYPQFRRRLWGFLYRRGFDPTVSGNTIRRLWRELSDPLDRAVDPHTDEQ
ncbi:MAG: RecX family transcriptional regulator [Chloroflexi bacterium]|nr:RecX family transcriptional regulator [Chloroflexota bacterium]